MVGDDVCESPQFSKQRQNKECSPTAQMNHQMAFQSDQKENQTQFSHYTIKEFSLNGSPESNGQVTQSFGTNFLDKKIGNTQMSVIIEEQQRSCAFSQAVRSKQNIDDSYSSQKQFMTNSNSQIFNYNYRESVPSKPKILYDSQDEQFSDKANPRCDKKIAAKQIILGQTSSQHIENNSKITSKSNDQKRQNQLQALLKSNQDSTSKSNDPFYIESPSKQRLIDQRDNENRKLLSNISFYEEQSDNHIYSNPSGSNISSSNQKNQGGFDQNIYQIYDNQFTPTQMKQKQIPFSSKTDDVSIFTTHPDALSASYNFQKNKNDNFAGVTSVSASFNKGFSQMKNNGEQQQRQYGVNASHSGNLNDQMNQYLQASSQNPFTSSQQHKLDGIQELNQDDLIQDSQQFTENGGRQLEKQQIQDFLNSKTLKSLKKSQGVMSCKQKKAKKTLGGGQQEKGSGGIQQYINSQNTKQTITDYFKQTNTQFETPLPSFDQYLSNFKTQYDKNIKRRLKSSIGRKSYDITQQHSKGFSQLNSKENSSFILKEPSNQMNITVYPSSATNRQNKIIRPTGNEFIINQQLQNEDQLHTHNFILLQQQQQQQQQQLPSFPLQTQIQQQQGRVPQLIEIQPKYESEYSRDASTIIRSIQSKLPPSSINTSHNDNSNVIKEINDQLSSIRSVRQTKSLNRPQKFLTEHSDSDVSSSINNPSTTKNQYYNMRIQENIKELDKLSTIHQEDTKHDLNSPSRYEEGNEFTFAQKEKKMKGRLYEVELNNIKINLDFNLSNSLSNYVNQKIPMASSKIKNIPKLQNNSFLGNSTGNFYQPGGQQPQSTIKDFQSSYASGFQNQDRFASKNSSNVTTMQFTNGTSTNTTNTTTKQTFQSPLKPIPLISGDKNHLVYSVKDNTFIESIHNTTGGFGERTKFLAQINPNKTQTPKQLDLSNIVQSCSSNIKTPSAKLNNKMKDSTNIYINKQQDPNEYFDKNKQQLQKRTSKTPIKQKHSRNENFIKIYKNQNSPENLLNYTEKSNKIIDQLITSNNTPINFNTSTDVAQSFKVQRNLEKQYLNQNFQLRPYLYKVRTQSEGRKRQQNIRVKTQQ